MLIYIFYILVLSIIIYLLYKYNFTTLTTKLITPIAEILQQLQTCGSDNNKWLGWATTTNFNDEASTWPNRYCQKSICRESIPQSGTLLYNGKNISVSRIGAAIPWGIVAQQYKNINEWIDDIVTSSYNGTYKNSQPPCYLVQQINKSPDQIKNNTDYKSAQFCINNNDCMDINDDNIAINPNTNEPFPIYVILPYEGCGGNCNKSENTYTGIDCVNSCPNYLIFEGNFNDIENITDSECMGIKSQYNNGTWLWDDQVSKKYFGKDPSFSNIRNNDLAISKITDYGRIRSQIANRPENGSNVNYCHTQNMHFDILNNNSLFVPNIPSDNSSGSNVFVRYKKVNCNILGNKNICNAIDCWDKSLKKSVTAEDVCGSELACKRN